ncbi:MAG: hypothetical protein JWN14_4662 [Chthonomonadales bacterium]|nr:hypothetical protein [Chthonomonadales bacterium]
MRCDFFEMEGSDDLLHFAVCPVMVLAIGLARAAQNMPFGRCFLGRLPDILNSDRKQTLRLGIGLEPLGHSSSSHMPAFR